MKYGLIVAVLTAFIAVYFRIFKSVISLTESFKCPLCYGTNLCADIENEKIKLEYSSFSDFFYNVFSVKNVYFGSYNNQRVVLKKLGHQNELDQIQQTTLSKFIDENLILEKMLTDNKLKICTAKTAKAFLEKLIENYTLMEIWTILHINAEPLILTLLKQTKWIPVIYGACGFIIVEEYCGLPLNHFSKSKWEVRAFLAFQLMEAALEFTNSNPRLYLTDISPDNIAVDDNFKLRFVDLENLILIQSPDNTTLHYSEYFQNDEFIYNEQAICEASLSDHNVYAVCKLLLSANAPWPMMEGGLLHSPPHEFLGEYKKLFNLLEKCVYSSEKLNRFNIAKEVMNLLEYFYIE